MAVTSSVPASEISSKSLRARDYVFHTLRAELVAELRAIHERREYYASRMRGLDMREAKILASFTS